MARTDNLVNFLTDIADAIRTKKQTTSEIPAEDFDQEILSIEGIDTTDATATASDIALNKTAYAKGEKITGTLINNRNNTLELDINGSNIDVGTSDVTVSSNLNSAMIVGPGNAIENVIANNILAEKLDIQASNIKKGVSVLGVEGTLVEGITPIGTNKTFSITDFSETTSTIGQPFSAFKSANFIKEQQVSISDYFRLITSIQLGDKIMLFFRDEPEPTTILKAVVVSVDETNNIVFGPVAIVTDKCSNEGDNEGLCDVTEYDDTSAAIAFITFDGTLDNPGTVGNINVLKCTIDTATNEITISNDYLLFNTSQTFSYRKPCIITLPGHSTYDPKRLCIYYIHSDTNKSGISYVIAMYSSSSNKFARNFAGDLDTTISNVREIQAVYLNDNLMDIFYVTNEAVKGVAVDTRILSNFKPIFTNSIHSVGSSNQRFTLGRKPVKITDTICQINYGYSSPDGGMVGNWRWDFLTPDFLKERFVKSCSRHNFGVYNNKIMKKLNNNTFFNFSPPITDYKSYYVGSFISSDIAVYTFCPELQFTLISANSNSFIEGDVSLIRYYKDMHVIDNKVVTFFTTGLGLNDNNTYLDLLNLVDIAYFSQNWLYRADGIATSNINNDQVNVCTFNVVQD